MAESITGRSPGSADATGMVELTIVGARFAYTLSEGDVWKVGARHGKVDHVAVADDGTCATLEYRRTADALDAVSGLDGTVLAGVGTLVARLVGAWHPSAEQAAELRLRSGGRADAVGLFDLAAADSPSSRRAPASCATSEVGAGRLPRRPSAVEYWPCGSAPTSLDLGRGLAPEEVAERELWILLRRHRRAERLRVLEALGRGHLRGYLRDLGVTEEHATARGLAHRVLLLFDDMETWYERSGTVQNSPRSAGASEGQSCDEIDEEPQCECDRVWEEFAAAGPAGAQGLIHQHSRETLREWLDALGLDTDGHHHQLEMRVFADVARHAVDLENEVWCEALAAADVDERTLGGRGGPSDAALWTALAADHRA